MADWSKIPYDLFLYLIENGNIQGLDLINLCISNPIINEKCNSRNQQLFRRLIFKKYNIELNKKYNARKFYENSSRIYADITPFEIIIYDRYGEKNYETTIIGERKVRNFLRNSINGFIIEHLADYSEDFVNMMKKINNPMHDDILALYNKIEETPYHKKTSEFDKNINNKIDFYFDMFSIEDLLNLYGIYEADHDHFEKIVII